MANKHRVALAEWPVIRADMNSDKRVNSLNALIKYLIETGYDGIEMDLENFKSLYFKDSKLSNEEIINIIKSKLDENGLSVFGILKHSRDNDWDKDNVDKYLSDLKESLYFNKKLGAEYVTFQIWLPDRYQTGYIYYISDLRNVSVLNIR